MKKCSNAAQSEKWRRISICNEKMVVEWRSHQRAGLIRIICATNKRNGTNRCNPAGSPHKTSGRNETVDRLPDYIVHIPSDFFLTILILRSLKNLEAMSSNSQWIRSTEISENWPDNVHRFAQIFSLNNFKKSHENIISILIKCYSNSQENSSEIRCFLCLINWKLTIKSWKFQLLFNLNNPLIWLRFLGNSWE